MIRSASYRLDVIRDGGRLCSLPCAAPPSITASADAEIKTSLSVTVADTDAVDWLRDRLRPILILDGIEYPLGLFLPSTITRTISERGRQLQVEAYDLSYLLTLRKTESILHLNANTPYLTAIESLISDAGIGVVQATPCADRLQTAREDWDMGTPYLEIINQLLGEINYRPAWVDASGILILEPDAPPTAERIDHTYDATTDSSVTLLEASSVSDYHEIPNVFVCVCSNPDYDAPLVATAVNDIAGSRLSVQARGIRIPQVTKVDNIASQAALQAYAERLRDESVLSTETVTISTALMPGHGIYDTIALRHPLASGIYQEIGWELSLEPGAAMTHTLRKAVIL